MSGRWLISLGVSRGLTPLAEGGAAFLAHRRGRALAVVALVNVLTNPAVVFLTLLWRAAGWPCEALWIAAAEAGAVAAEGVVYCAWPEDFPHPWRFSLALNALSFTLGLVFSLLF